ncbi:unnamed protein product (macronuclear) [Paramecium tetraurelia]|uniref:Chromosome undetermined scaffold_92, whole genome shotgun sequence n=1 Tax=Paramecium tetraurelia TaxID=5888 RepID=Q3SE29_PARTE|nr:uncharacterized protein GSPATT00026105001 [Paramecium tetraurelia]CAI39096.1 Dicer-like ribonuclease with mutated helicase and Rnase III domains [Paramecium tetraurelia]CAK93783.1 unnamed protein product [Paramecium tetraurelia]|eukprot:XP_001461156.1 hypothetical protein (macronuclear) [Paramecium tetraurelia strain d4-2]
MQQFSNQTIISDQTHIQQSNRYFQTSDKQDLNTFQQLDTGFPFQNIFDLSIFEANQSQQEQPNNSIKEMVNSMLASISNNEEILGMTSANIDDDQFDDQLDDLEFRECLYELQQKALNQNCILHQENYKTQVATLLMWNQLYKNPNKKVGVLTTTIQKADNLAKQIKTLLPRLVETYLGDQSILKKAQEFCDNLQIIHPNKCTDLWNNLVWQVMLQENNIYVMTSEIFVNSLRRGYWNFTDFSFIYLDDCQSTIFDNSYNHLFKEFYFPLKSSLQVPIIVGVYNNSMYANNKFIADEQILKDLVQLCANMDARFININIEAVKQRIKETKITISTYKSQIDESKIHKMLYSNNQYRKLNSYLHDKEMSNNISYMLKDFTDVLSEFKSNHNQSANISEKIIANYFEQVLLKQAWAVCFELGQYPFNLILKFIIQQFQLYFNTKQLQCTEFSIHNKLEWLLTETRQLKNQNTLSPKIKLLHNLLTQTYENPQIANNRILIYVKHQNLAFYLLKTLQYISQSKSQGLKIGMVEKIKEESDQKRMQIDFTYIYQELYQNLQRSQIQFSLSDLKNELVQLDQIFNLDQLIYESKQNCELDQCQVVITSQLDVNFAFDFQQLICFNPLPHTIYDQLMRQMKDKQLQIIMMREDENTNKKQKIQFNYQSNFYNPQKVEKIIDECTIPQREQILQKAIDNLQNKAIHNMHYECYTIQKSGALLNTNWACNLIEYFNLQINLEKKGTKVSKYAIYQLKNGQQKQSDHYIAFLLLPNQVQNTIFYGNKAQGAKEAKASVAFQAAIQLYQKGYFDCHLNSYIQNNIGQNIGAHQVDPSVIMTKEQLNIQSKYCLIIRQKYISILRGMVKERKYYHTCQKSLLVNEKQESIFIKQKCKFQKESIQLIYPKQFQEKLKQCQTFLKMLDISLLEEQTISQDEYLELYKKYIESIIYEEDLISTQNDHFTRARSEIKFKIQFKIVDYGLIIISDQSKYQLIKKNFIVNQFLLALKSNLFKKLIEPKLKIMQDLEEANQYNVTPNYILNNLNQFYNHITPILLNVKVQNQEPKLILRKKRQEKMANTGLVVQNLDQVILNSLNVSAYKLEDLMLGSSYYKFLITIQLLLNYPTLDSKILEQTIKHFSSITYIRNCLMESYIFLYLQIYDESDISKALIGFERFDINYDVLLSQQSGDFTESPFNQKDIMKISDIDFKQFLQQSLQIIEKEDYQQTKGFDWLRILNITKKLEKQISSQKDLKQLCPQHIWDNQNVGQLKSIYQKFEEIIKYQFNSFELLFQALTDVSFKMIINNEVQQQYMEKFQSKDEFQGWISESELQEYIKQIDQMNSIAQSSYQNSDLAILGKSLWDYALMKILNEMSLDNASLVTLYKILKGISFLTYAAIKLKIHQYLNSSFQKQLQSFVDLYEKTKDQSITFHISSIPYNENSIMLRNAFLALVGAIYIDSDFELAVVLEWIKSLFTQINVDELYQPEFLQSRQRYQFYQWYQKHFGNPFNFDLIKIPHQDQKKIGQGMFLYMPYDQKEGQIVNIKGEKFYQIAQLHIYAKCKSQAWDKLYELIEH